MAEADGYGCQLAPSSPLGPPDHNRSDFSLVDGDADADSPTNEGQKMFLQVVELLRQENEVRNTFIIIFSCTLTHYCYFIVTLMRVSRA